jgi:uncharacterized membrane protein
MLFEGLIFIHLSNDTKFVLKIGSVIGAVVFVLFLLLFLLLGFDITRSFLDACIILGFYLFISIVAYLLARYRYSSLKMFGFVKEPKNDDAKNDELDRAISVMSQGNSLPEFLKEK